MSRKNKEAAPVDPASEAVIASTAAPAHSETVDFNDPTEGHLKEAAPVDPAPADAD